MCINPHINIGIIDADRLQSHQMKKAMGILILSRSLLLFWMFLIFFPAILYFISQIINAVFFPSVIEQV
jgi:hypothetical protein